MDQNQVVPSQPTLQPGHYLPKKKDSIKKHALETSVPGESPTKVPQPLTIELDTSLTQDLLDLGAAETEQMKR